MQAFYPSPRNVVLGVVLCMLFYGLWGFSHMTPDDPVTIIVAFTPPTLILGTFYFLFWWRRRPTLLIDNGSIEVRALFGKARAVAPPSEYTLVVAKTYLAFRKAGQRDIVVFETSFNKETWRRLVRRVRRLPFAAVE